MAPANSPGRKKRDRDNQFFEVGVQGRKTGITLPVGQKDEHGIEDLDGIFSSPEKSPPRRVVNGRTTLSSSDMDLAQSSVPEPTEVLTTRRILKSSKTTFPPPMGRSPYKTNIGSSPRRQSSAAPLSQARLSLDRDDRASSHPAVSRRLDFSVNDVSTSVAQSPLRQPARRGKGPPRKDIYRLTASPGSLAGRNQDGDILEEEEEDATAPEHTIEPTMDTEDATEMPIHDDYQDEVPVMEDSIQLLDEEPDQLPLSSPSVPRRSRYHPAEPETTLEPGGGEEDSALSDSRRGTRKRTSLPNSDSVSSPAVIAKKPPVKKAPPQKMAAVSGRGRKGKSNLLVSAAAQPTEDSFPSPELPEETEVINHEESEDDSPIEQPVVAKKRGRAAKVVPAEEPDDSNAEVVAPKKRGRAPKPTPETREEPPDERPKTKKQGRLAKTTNGSTNGAALHATDDSASEPTQKKKRGRPARTEDETTRPTKKAKTTVKKPVAQSSKMGPPASKKPAPRAASESPIKRSTRAPSVASTAFPGGRSHTMLREATPFEEEGTRRTRSGRSVITPLEFWLGEKVEYERDGGKKILKKAEQIELPKLERGRATSAAPRRKRKAAASMDVFEEDEEMTLEDWEERKETIRVIVQRWDPVAGVTLEDEEEFAVAFGVNSLPVEMVGGSANFAFTKTHSSHFFGTGIIEIPPLGYKMRKNSRKMTMGFFMHTGKVEVMVADQDFTISKGGVFHVPRGNVYSIHNPSQEHTARIFFSQGCEMPAVVEE
ncbi:hypothetical protein FKW77_005787 [Venturia effusa]|uniref:CENP-C homolog n=1 Tax=Venturia effusa TaxID=50376 RepID=A0A517LMW6_9PEZI|nr:hypothetical protein FKW77_005787 [Venturia effusa]